MSDRFVFVKFQKSRTKGKKYDAILFDKISKRRQTIPFGSIFYEQYYDSTGLGLYKRLDHLDRKRRASYLARHAETLKKKYSSSWFSAKYLWSANI